MVRNPSIPFLTITLLILPLQRCERGQVGVLKIKLHYVLMLTASICTSVREGTKAPQAAGVIQ